MATHRSRVLTEYRSPATEPKDVAASPAPTGPTAGLVAVVTPPVPGTAGSALTLLGPDGRARWVRRVPDLGGWPMTARFTADGRRLGVVVVAGYSGAAPIRSAVYVDTRTGRAGPPVFRHPIGAGEDSSQLGAGVLRGRGDRRDVLPRRAFQDGDPRPVGSHHHHALAADDLRQRPAPGRPRLARDHARRNRALVSARRDRARPADRRPHQLDVRGSHERGRVGARHRRARPAARGQRPRRGPLGAPGGPARTRRHRPRSGGEPSRAPAHTPPATTGS